MEDMIDISKSPKRLKRVERIKKLIRFWRIFIRVLPWAVAIGLLTAVFFSYNRVTDITNEKESLDARVNELVGEVENLHGELDLLNVSLDNAKDELAMYDRAKSDPLLVKDLQLSEEQLYMTYKKVYLTFDDGPSDNTDEILDILARHNVKATFFVIKKTGDENERLLRRIVEEGHTLGMHSCNHVYDKVYSSVEGFKEDTQEIRQYLFDVTGMEPVFYRFPGGSSNNVSNKVDMKVLAKYLLDSGIVYYDWNVSAEDAVKKKATVSSIVSNVMNDIEKKDECVVLMHDMASKDNTVEALDEILNRLEAMEKTVVLPITKDTTPVVHLLPNEE